MGFPKAITDCHKESSCRITSIGTTEELLKREDLSRRRRERTAGWVRWAGFHERELGTGYRQSVNAYAGDRAALFIQRDMSGVACAFLLLDGDGRG